MATTTFVDGVTVVEAEWLNEVNDTVFDALGAATTPAEARTELNVPQRDGTDATGNWPINAAGLSTPLATTSGGTGANYANAAAVFNGIKQTATEGSSGVLEIGTTAETQAAVSDGVIVTPLKLKQAQIQLSALQSPTAVTSVDFTNIPSWVKRVTVMLSGFSTNGTSVPIIQLGIAAGLVTTAYLGSAVAVGTGNTPILGTAGIPLAGGVAASSVLNGSVVIENLGGNLWVARGLTGRSDAAVVNIVASSRNLGDTLTQLRVTTVGGADLIDAGTSLSISYE